MKPATVRALRLLDARGSDGVTDAEYHAATGFWRLAARVGEIRAVLGDGAVETVYERTADGASRFARYFRRPAAAPMRGTQLDLSDLPVSPAGLPPSPGGAVRDARVAPPAATGR